MCVAFLAKYKVIDVLHIETVYLDPNDEFLTQAVIHYMGQPK